MTCESHASYAIDAWPMRILALDSTLRGYSGGYIDDERLAWLDAELRAHPRRPTIVAMHHPPFRTGNAGLDRYAFRNVEALAEVVRSHRHITRLVAGHLHTVLMRPWCGTIACTAPSTSPQFVLGRSMLGIGVEAAGMLLHEWSFNAEVYTYIVRIESGLEQQIA